MSAHDRLLMELRLKELDLIAALKHIKALETRLSCEEDLIPVNIKDNFQYRIVEVPFKYPGREDEILRVMVRFS